MYGVSKLGFFSLVFIGFSPCLPNTFFRPLEFSQIVLGIFTCTFINLSIPFLPRLIFKLADIRRL